MKPERRRQRCPFLYFDTTVFKYKGHEGTATQKLSVFSLGVLRVTLAGSVQACVFKLFPVNCEGAFISKLFPQTGQAVPCQT
jgi:hypothetical protein